MKSSESINFPFVLILAASMILFLSFGMRSSFGLFLQPMIDTLGWERSVLAMGIALQNLIWGIFQPFVGIAADKFGTKRIIILGGVSYALGLVLMSISTAQWLWYFGSGFVTGFALSATAYVLVLGAAAKMAPENIRGRVLGAISSLGMIGQFVMPFLCQKLVAADGIVSSLGTATTNFDMFGLAYGQMNNWSGSYQILAIIMLLIVPLTYVLLRSEKSLHNNKDIKTQMPGNIHDADLRKILRSASATRDYYLLTFGFLVCGFQVTFIMTHFPAYLSDQGMGGDSGMVALMLIGIFNVAGTYLWGHMADFYSNKNLLSLLYLGRGLAIAAFFLVPISDVSLWIFSSVIGFLWLGTVPLTSNLVGKMFGSTFMTTLFGIVFFGHQIGGFLGAYIGGYVFDQFNDYDAVWVLSIVLSFIATILHWNIFEEDVTGRNIHNERQSKTMDLADEKCQ